MCNDARRWAPLTRYTFPCNTATMYLEALVFLPQVYITTVQSCKSDIAKQGFFSERD